MSQLLNNPFFFYIRHNKRPFILGISLLIVTNFLDSIWPLILKQGLDLIEAHKPMSELTKTCLTFAVVMISLSVFRYGWRRNWGEFHSTASESLRRTLFDHIIHMGTRFFYKNPPGELMSLMTNDIQSFRQGIGPGFLIFADGFIYTCIVLPIMINLNATWVWKSLILLPLVPFMIWFVMKKIQTNYKLQQDIFSELTRFTEEQISGIRVVKGFGLERVRLKMYEDVSKRLEKQSFKTSTIDAIFMPIMDLSATFGGVILLAIAYKDVLAGTATVGTFIAFHRYIMKMVWPMTAFGLGLSYWQKGKASFKRIREVLEEKTDTPNSGKLVLKELSTLEFRNVSFQYPGSSQYALKNLSFQISSGEKLAVLGPIGAGKSTLINLILRLFPLTEGQILINGHSHTEYTLESLRKVIQLVPQEPFLFGRSVVENVMMGQILENPQDGESEKLDRRLWSELAKFQIAEEVQKLPEKEKSLLGEKGVNLSGGQKQRLTLARAYASDPKLMILDDVLSAVDVETEKKISEGLFENNQMTYIIIAHRLSTVENTDQVLILRNGETEYFGPWDQAFAKSQTLATFLSIQKDHGGSESEANEGRKA